MTERKFPDGFYWGEKAWEAFARPCQVVLEWNEQNYLQGYNNLGDYYRRLTAPLKKERQPEQCL